MARYVGWGGLSNVFDENKTNHPEWGPRFHEVRELLNDDEYAAARRSTLDSFYTSESVIRSIYSTLEHLGVDGNHVKRVLEPSCGIGNFIGLRPESLSSAGFTAIEQDDMTARIAQRLHPNQRVLNSGLQDIRLRHNHYDLVVGNPPFGNQRLYDPNYKDDARFSIHNYFIAKSLEGVKPGGTLAFVVSRHFLDQKNPEAREHVASKADLVGAIRLPTDAFKENANTDVTTDLIFLRKHDGQRPADRPAWIETRPVHCVYDGPRGPENKSVPVNEFFHNNERLCLGELQLQSGPHGPRAVWASQGADIESRIKQIVASDFNASGVFQRDVCRVASVSPGPIANPPSDEQSEQLRQQASSSRPKNASVPEYISQVEPLGIDRLQPGSLFLKNGQLHEVGLTYEGETDIVRYEPPNKAAEQRITGMIAIRDTLRHLLDAERDPDTSENRVDQLRQRLNDTYDGYQKKWGYLSATANRRLMRIDPQWPLVESLENNFDPGVSKAIAERDGVEARAPSATKADIFEKRVTRHPEAKPERFETVQEAYLYALNQHGSVSDQMLQDIERLTSRDRNQVLRELDGEIFKNPITERYETASQYLSGNVRQKLHHANEANHAGQYDSNVHALKNVQPADIDAADIAIQLNSTWVPGRYVEQFAQDILKGREQKALFLPEIGRWNCKFTCGSGYIAKTEWGIPEYPAHKLLASIMENTPIQVWRDGPNDTRVIDGEKTAVANRKAKALQNAYVDWVWKTAARREDLSRLYNTLINTHRSPAYDGSHLELQGANPDITLRPHQKNAVWRGLQSRSALFDHTVGAGKTMVNIALAMEGQRMGIFNKPMVVVPNHLLKQWQDDFYKLYPDARVLIAEKDQMAKANRERFVSRIATGNWQAIIISHSAFKRLEMPDEYVQKWLSQQVNELTKAIFQMKAEDGTDMSVKDLERTKERLEAKLSKAIETGDKDQVLKFTDLGVDALMVDEADEFKNLHIATKHARIGGLGNLAGSDRAMDMFMKTRWLDENEGNVYFSTGTPISNSISEVFTMQRYLDYQGLKEKHLEHFDAWVSTYGQLHTGLELDATGVNFRINTKFSKFQNVPELIEQYRSFADVITKRDLYDQAEAAGQRFPIPKIAGGKPENIVVPRSEQQASFMGIQDPEYGTWNEGSIIYRMENLPDDPRIDNPLNITTDARKAGLDYRLINPTAPDFEESKVNRCVSEAIKIYRDYEDVKGTQLIFCDLSTPKKGKGTATAPKANSDEQAADSDDNISVSMDDLIASRSKFSVYEDIRTKLIDQGVPPAEIAFIHDANTDAKKAKLFADVCAGNVRFLLGSTGKMGAGTNVQERLVALHDLDCPWRPRDLEQRLGRIERQGNKLYMADPDNFRIQVKRYATEQTYDSRMWQTVESKAAAIEQFRRGDLKQRTIDDVQSDAASAAEMKAAATGNHLIFLQVQLDHELKELEADYASWKRSRYSNENRIAQLERRPEYHDRKINEYTAEVAYAQANATDDKCFMFNDRRFGKDDREPVINHMQVQIASVVNKKVQTADCGIYEGYRITCFSTGGGGNNAGFAFRLNGADEHEPSNLRYRLEDGKLNFALSGFLQRIENYTQKTLGEEIEYHQRHKVLESTELTELRDKVSAELRYPHEQRLELLRQDASDVLNELRKSQKDHKYKSQWQPRSQQLQLAEDSEEDANKSKACMTH